MDDTVKVMSPRQRDLLARLIDEKQIDATLYDTVKARLQMGTSMKVASGLITMLLAAPDKEGVRKNAGPPSKEGWYKHPETGVLYHVVKSRNGFLIALGCNERTGKHTKWCRGVQFQLTDADCVDAR